MECLIPEHALEEHISTWLKEDMPNLDYTGYLLEDTIGTANILCKSPGMLCGTPFVTSVFKRLHCEVKWLCKEGDVLTPVCRVAEVSGKVRDILLGERISLNLLSRASGIATSAKRLVKIKESSKWIGDVAGTRKTTPGFRLVEKYSLLVGGCALHRYDLSSMVMLKDNHIWSVGSIDEAVKKARKACGFSTKIEVECRSVQEALAACKAGADVVMLDNFAASVTEEAAIEIKGQYPGVVLEVSGGICEENISDYMTPSVDVISTSTLTQGYKCIDFSLKIIKDGHDPTNPIVKDIHNHKSV